MELLRLGRAELRGLSAIPHMCCNLLNSEGCRAEVEVLATSAAPLWMQ